MRALLRRRVAAAELCAANVMALLEQAEKQEETLTVGVLAERLGVQRSMVTLACRALIHRGLVTVTLYVVELTDGGRELLAGNRRKLNGPDRPWAAPMGGQASAGTVFDQ